MLMPVVISIGRMSRSVLPSRRLILPPSLLDVDLLQPCDRSAEKARSDLAEPLRRVGHEEMVPAPCARPAAGREEAALLEPRAHRLRGGPGRIDQGDAGPDRLADDPLEQ